jgi:hypothetical protein
MIKIRLMLSVFKDLFTKKEDFFNEARSHAIIQIEKLCCANTYSQFIAGNYPTIHK